MEQKSISESEQFHETYYLPTWFQEYSSDISITISSNYYSLFMQKNIHWTPSQSQELYQRLRIYIWMN